MAFFKPKLSWSLASAYLSNLHPINCKNLSLFRFTTKPYTEFVGSEYRENNTTQHHVHYNTTHSRKHLSTCPRLRFREQSSEPVDSDAEFELDDFDNREFQQMTVEDFEHFYKDNGSEDIKDRIKTILDEYEFTKYNSAGRVPTTLDVKDMDKLITEGTTSFLREKIFNFLFKREMVKRAQVRKREAEKKLVEERREAKYMERSEIHGIHERTGLVCEKGKLIYGLWHNSLFCRINEKKFRNKASINNLLRAATESRPIIFDFSYDEYMTSWTARSLGEQMQEAYSLNRYREYDESFDLWFCNFNRTSPVGEFLEQKALPTLFTKSMITVKEDCYTNYFDKERLVYLSPHSRERLKRVSRDDIFIIGAFNDKGNVRPLSYRKALSKGIRCVSLPIDSFVAWQGPSKSLCVNHVLGILLDFMDNGGDWSKALHKHIPSRKIKSHELLVEEEERRRAKRVKRFYVPKFSLADP